MAFCLLRHIENPERVGTFGGYVGEGEVNVWLDGEETRERVADWEPIDGHGQMADWPPKGDLERGVVVHMNVLPDEYDPGVFALTYKRVESTVAATFVREDGKSIRASYDPETHSVVVQDLTADG